MHLKIKNNRQSPEHLFLTFNFYSSIIKTEHIFDLFYLKETSYEHSSLIKSKPETRNSI